MQPPTAQSATSDVERGSVAPPEVLAQPTRARIYAALGELRAPATTADLARRLGLHPNGVRRHLQRLLEFGLVRRHREPRGRGRPPDAWSAAEPPASGPEAYADMARWLARAIPSRPGREDEIERAGHSIGRELAPAEGTVSGDPADARREFTEILTRLGFQPELEASGEGGTICHLGRCPYADSVRENPRIVCALHRGLTAGVLERLSPEARMTRFEARDPEQAGCLIEVDGLD